MAHALCTSTDLFEVVPSPVVTYTGEDAIFHCVAQCDGIRMFWLINDTIAGQVENIATRTETGLRRDGQAGKESTLWITVITPANNNSVIKCTAVDRNNSMKIFSTPGVQLKVQG